MALIMTDTEIADHYRGLKHKGRAGVRLISELCAASEDEIWDALERKGVPVNRPKRKGVSFYGEDRDNVQKSRWYARGLTDVEIASMAGVTQATVRGWRIRHNLPRNEREDEK